MVDSSCGYLIVGHDAARQVSKSTLVTVAGPTKLDGELDFAIDEILSFSVNLLELFHSQLDLFLHLLFGHRHFFHFAHYLRERHVLGWLVCAEATKDIPDHVKITRIILATVPILVSRR